MILFTITFTPHDADEDDEPLKWQITLPGGATSSHALEYFHFEQDEDEGEPTIHDITWEGD